MDACLGEVNEPFTNTGLLKRLLKVVILMNIILTVSSYINNNITFVRSYNLALNTCILKTVLDNYASAKVALLFSNNPIEYLFLLEKSISCSNFIETGTYSRGIEVPIRSSLIAKGNSKDLIRKLFSLW